MVQNMMRRSINHNHLIKQKRKINTINIEPYIKNLYYNPLTRTHEIYIALTDCQLKTGICHMKDMKI